jgi:hypothetical protein
MRVVTKVEFQCKPRRRLAADSVQEPCVWSRARCFKLFEIVRSYRRYSNTGAAAEHSVPAAPADSKQWMAIVLLVELMSYVGYHCLWQAVKGGLRLASWLPLWVAAPVHLLRHSLQLRGPACRLNASKTHQMCAGTQRTAFCYECQTCASVRRCPSQASQRAIPSRPTFGFSSCFMSCTRAAGARVAAFYGSLEALVHAQLRSS